ncbi:MAG: VWA domain-containing protein [Acidobacteria bacterium]|nr:VWA domain-containing protein [Acidobacteriota bacterium]
MKQLAMIVALLLTIVDIAAAQAGRRSPSDTGLTAVTLPVILESAPAQGDRNAISRDQIELYDGGIIQEIEYFRPDYSPAKMVVLVDNTERMQASVAEMTEAVKALAANLYQGDQMMVIGYDEQPEIIQDFTDDRKKLAAGGAMFRKKDSPKSLDALQATINDVFRLQIGVTKRVIVLISDGYDWESTTPVKSVVEDLARENIVVYVLQTQDRTYGAPRRRAMKPVDLIEKLTKATGGRAFPLKESQQAAREILQELSERWYQLSYKPKGVNSFNTRRLLITVSDPKIHLRTKLEQPGESF